MTTAGSAPTSIWSGALLPVTAANLTVVALAAFDGLAIVAAVPAITEDLGDVALVPWVITAFLATSAVAGVLAGPVIDAKGVRATFRVTGLWFLLTSLAVALAPSMGLLIVARALQGIGGGLVISVSLSSVGLAYTEALRPRAFAANSMVWGVMGFGGPALVAAMLAVGNWRLVFFLQLPLTALALVVGWRSLPTAATPSRRIAVDWPGIIALTGLVAGSLVAVGVLDRRPGTALLTVGGAVAAAAVVWRRGARDHAVIRRDHLRRHPLRAVHLTAGLLLVAGLAADNYLPIYVQTVRGWSLASAPFSILFLTVGWTAGALLASRLLARYRQDQLILVGACIAVPALTAAAGAARFGWPSVVILTGYLVIGVAIGLVSTSGLTLLQSVSQPGEMGRTNSAHQFIRTICITYGVAVGGAILLAIVDRRTGDVETVRALLAGDEGTVSAETGDAIAAGFVAIHWFSLVAAIGCLAAAWSLGSATRRRVRESPAA